jgi:PAS domain S-box-containing protein
MHLCYEARGRAAPGAAASCGGPQAVRCPDRFLSGRPGLRVAAGLLLLMVLMPLAGVSGECRFTPDKLKQRAIPELRLSAGPAVLNRLDSAFECHPGILRSLGALAVALILAMSVALLLQRNRRLTDQLLRENEELLRLSTDVAGVAVWEYNVVENRLTRSENHDRLYGLEPREDRTLSTFLNAAHADDRASLHTVVEQSVAAGGADCCHADFRVLWPDGSLHWLSVTGEAAERDSEGRARLVRGCLQDITDRKLAEEKIRAGEIRFRALFEQAGDYCMILDPNTADGIPVIVDANKAAYTVHGYTREEFIGRPVTDMDDAEGRRLTAERTRQIMSGRPFFVENTHVRKDGSAFSVAVHANRIDIEGEPPLIFTTEYDITELKQVEEELRKERNLLQFSLDASHTGAWYLDLVDHTSNRTLGHDRIFGYPTLLPEWTYERFLEHVLPEDREKTDRMFQEAIASHSDWNCECRIRRADGAIRWIGAIGRHGFKVDGTPRLMTGIVQDITERKQREEELQTAHDLLEKRVAERTAELKVRTDEAETLNRAMVNLMEDLKETNRGLEAAQSELRTTNSELESFSYSVSHDLRAPLRHIDGFVKLLLKREADRLDATSERYLDTIARSSGRMGRLIDDLLAFSRTGRTRMTLQSVDANGVVEEAMHELSPLTEGRRVAWTIGDLPAVQADRSLLRLVWQNLIGNALKYTAQREEARIEIGATHEPGTDGSGEFVFFIRDNGAGFDPEYTHKLFGVFQRLHRDEEFEGTGIGLATVRRIVQRHGGRVWAEGAVDQGAAFYFTLKDAKGAD